MDEAFVSSLLARTATHEANAWLLSIAAGVLGAFGALFFTRRTRSEYGLFLVVLAAAVVGAMLGAALLPIALRVPAAIGARHIAPLLVGDRMAIGALVGFALAGALAARRLGLDVRRALDQLAPSMGVLVVLGRIGCFLEGCDFGAVTGVAWGVSYPAGSHAFDQQLARGLVRVTDATALAVHPAQLYEAAAGLAMIAAAAWCLRGSARSPRRSPGVAFRAALGVYAVGRFVIEPLRGDPRPFLGPLSMPQWLCLGVAAWCVGASLADGREGAAQTGGAP